MNLSWIDMSPSSDERGFNINAYARKVEVDNRIALHFYYRIADNLLRQANIYREENNLIDLYIILLRFSSLLCETIPSHRDYHASLPKEKASFKKKLLDVLDELESLKPVVQKQFNERNREVQFDYQERVPYASSTTNSPSVRMQISTLPHHGQSGSAAVSSSAWKYSYERAQVASADKGPMTKRSSKPYLGLPYPKEETLSRHSILGPNGLSGQWNVPATGIRVQYPSNFGSTKVETSSNLHQVEQSTMEREKDATALKGYASDMASVLSLDDGKWLQSAELSSLSVDIMPQQFNQLSIRQPSPPPVVAQVHRPTSLVAIPPENVADPRPGPPVSSTDGVSDTKSYQHLHIPVKMMESFLRLAEKNTARNLETCGVLAGSLKKKVFCVTTLIIPKQEATSDSCQTLNEEEIFDYQDSRSLFPLGWIHTHPTQTCFMSSVDLHTHYSYQIMLPEAVAIVMAPTDETRTHGIFHLSDPGGVSVIRNCQQRGFHPHEEPSDGSPLYEHCSHVYMNANLQFEVADLR